MGYRKNRLHHMEIHAGLREYVLWIILYQFMQKKAIAIK